MLIYIDDTYGPQKDLKSRYVTEKRKTHVGLEIPEINAEEYSSQYLGVLDFLKNDLQLSDLKEIHFTDLYQKRGVWKTLPDSKNLWVFQFFMELYKSYRWKVHVQTIDERTLKEHNIKKYKGNLGCFNLAKREHLSFFWLLIKIKRRLPPESIPFSVIADEGIKKANYDFTKHLDPNKEWLKKGMFCSSKEKPLLQLADFLAFCINRNTYLSFKQDKTETDFNFIELFADMDINSPDLSKSAIPMDFNIDDIDYLIYHDRKEKGL